MPLYISSSSNPQNYFSLPPHTVQRLYASHNFPSLQLILKISGLLIFLHKSHFRAPELAGLLWTGSFTPYSQIPLEYLKPPTFSLLNRMALSSGAWQSSCTAEILSLCEYPYHPSLKKPPVTEPCTTAIADLKWSKTRMRKGLAC